ncbi:uncharacterized protein LOC108887482 isoform X1 [Lates japonicus]|uniref:Ig-like domain-containing protein n=1 Tax=Lates japonicus TaxID=270547 RepID=A0AAD3MLM0_LATJO|nr:uncharacterized protein AKAME5_000929400 [Lates japonicus]
MVEFRWIKIFLFLILVLPLGALTEQPPTSFIVRVGDKVTLPCENVRDDHDNCDGIRWLYSNSEHTNGVDLVTFGKTGESGIFNSKPDSLSVTKTCSLVVKKVTVEDFGQYGCRRFKSGHFKDAVVYLSVIKMTEQKNRDQVTLNCSVSTYGQCTHTVKWLPGGNDVDEDNEDLETSQSDCWTSVSFTMAHSIYTNYQPLKCEVTDGYTDTVQQFTFSPQTSDWWWYIILAVGLAALLVTGVVLIKLKKNKGNKTQMDENMADPEDGVSYASISHNKNTNSKAQIRGGDDAVTYSTVKTPSSSAGASTDPSALYATVNKPHE